MKRDERNETAQECAACGCEYDNRSGGTCGFDVTTTTSDEVLCLCESCFAEAKDLEVEELGAAEDCETLTKLEFNTVKLWAKKERVLVYGFDLPIQTVERMEGFFDALSAFVGWHPDTEFPAYVGDDNESLFAPAECLALGLRLAECFSLCQLKGLDLYELAFESAQRAGWAPEAEQDYTMNRRMADDKAGGPAPAISRAEVMADPAASFWLKGALEKASQRDSLDALRDAETLAKVLRAEYGKGGAV